MKKQTKAILITAGIVGLLFLISYFGFNLSNLSIVSPVENDGVTAQLTENIDEYANYYVHVDLTGDPSSRDRDRVFSATYQTNTKGIYPLDIAENMIEGEWFETGSYNIGGLNAICNWKSSNEGVDGSIRFSNTKVECMFNNGYVYAKFRSDIESDCGGDVGINIAGDLWANCKILKQGYEVPEEPKTYYRLTNNQCNLISLFPSEVTENDYNTLKDCQSKIEYKTTYYRFSDNNCLEVSIYLSQKTNLDYELLGDCEVNIEKHWYDFIFRWNDAISKFFKELFT